MSQIKTELINGYKSETSISEVERFEKAAKPLMEFLAENFHPHVTVIVTSNSAELVEGLMIHNS